MQPIRLVPRYLHQHRLPKLTGHAAHVDTIAGTVTQRDLCIGLLASGRNGNRAHRRRVD